MLNVTLEERKAALNKARLLIKELKDELNIELRDQKTALFYLMTLFATRRISKLDYLGDRIVWKVSRKFLLDNQRWDEGQLRTFAVSNNFLNKEFHSLGLKTLTREMFTTNIKNRYGKISASLLEFIVGLIAVCSTEAEARNFLKTHIYREGKLKELELGSIKYFSSGRRRPMDN